MTREDLRRQRSSPLVRRIASEHNVDITQISGIGHQRTRHQERHPRLHRASAGRLPPAARRQPAAPGAARRVDALHVPAYAPGERVEVVPMTVMRKKIAEHMIFSTHTSAHVHSVFEVDYTQVVEDPRREKGRLRARRRQAHVPVVHREGDRRRAARDAGAQLVDRRRLRSSTRRTSTSASPSRSTGA